MTGRGRSRSRTAACDELRHWVLEVVDPVVGHKSGRCPVLDPGGRCLVPANREVALRLDDVFRGSVR